VNKTELIEHIALQADISKAAAARAVDAMIVGVSQSLKKRRAGLAGRIRHLRGVQPRRPGGPQPAHRGAGPHPRRAHSPVSTRQGVARRAEL